MNQKQKISGRDIIGYLFLGVSIIMLGKSLMLCFSSDIWYDELFTVGMIEHSYGDLIAFTARDVHPPLYYCIVKFVVDLCKLVSPLADPVVIAKVVSVLPYFILLVYGVTFIRRRFGIFAGGLFLFCTIAMPQLSSYTVEVRMYSFALLFVTAAYLHAYGTITCCEEDGYAEKMCNGQPSCERGKKDGTDNGKTRKCRMHGIALVCYGLAAAYTQYFACVAVIMVYFYVLVAFLLGERDRIKEWLLWVAVSIVGYVPWLYVLFRQITAVREDYWILPLTWRSLGGCVKFIMKPAFTDEVLNTVLAVLLFTVYVAVFAYAVAKLYHYRRHNQRNPQNTNWNIKQDANQNIEQNINQNVNQSIKHNICPYKIYKRRVGFALAGVGVLAGLVMFGFVASFAVRPIFVYRYMIPALGCFWLGYALTLDDMASVKKLCKSNLAEQHEKEQHRKGKFTGDKIPRIVSGIIILCTFVIGLRNYRAFMGEEEYKILLMEQTETALSSIAPDDIVIYNFDQVQAVTSYYLDSDMQSYLWCGTPETLIQDIIRPYGTVEDVQVIKEWCEDGRNVWFVGSFNSRDDIVEEWSGQGMHVEEIGSYLLERYWFNLYKVSM